MIGERKNNGRLSVPVAQNIGVNVRYLPRLAVRQLSDNHAGKYLFVFLPGRPRRRKFPPAKFLNGIEEAPAGAYTRLTNQIRSALVGSNPVFERGMRGQAITGNGYCTC